MKKKKLMCLQGLPASGKSTWAKKFISENPWWMRVNKDDIRKQMWISYDTYDKNKEQLVVDAERSMVESMIKAGMNVIVDNTHLLLKRGNVNKHLEFYWELAKKYGYEFEVKPFFITLEEAIERDANREDKDEIVGKSTYDRLLSYSVMPPKFPANPVFKKIDNKLPYVIICDIDGTMAFMNWKRSPYDYSKVSGDEPNIMLSSMLRTFLETTKLEVIFLSGREDGCYSETRDWLDNIGFWNCDLLMRKSGDTRCDTVVKEELYNKYIKDKYNVFAVFDDRNRVVDKWRELWLPTYQVWYWAF